MEMAIIYLLLAAGAFFSLGLIGVSVIAAHRSFRLGRTCYGLGFLGLIALWLAAHIPLPIVLFAVSYSESGQTNLGAYIVLLTYLTVAAGIFVRVTYFLRKPA